MPQRETLTIPEAAELLGIGRNLAYELAARDELPVPVLRLGRRILVARRPLLEALGMSDAPASNGEGASGLLGQEEASGDAA